MPEITHIDAGTASTRPIRGNRALVAALLTLLCGVVAPFHLAAAPFAYSAMGDQGNQLIEIDLADGSIRPIGAFGAIGNIPLADVEGMALDSKGRLFAVSDVAETLLRIDVASGAATPVGQLYGLGLRGQGLGPFNQLDVGLAFTCDGRLWMSSDAVSKLWEIEQTTGVAMEVGPTGAKISGLAAYDNQLYGLGVDEDEGLYRIDRETGAATLIGRTGLPYAFYDAGLDFDADGNLWASLDFNPPPSGRTQDYRVSEIVQIDVETGLAGTPIPVQGPLTIEIEALAMAPAACVEGIPPVDPEPINVTALDTPRLALLAAVLALIGLVGLRRR